MRAAPRKVKRSSARYHGTATLHRTSGPSIVNIVMNRRRYSWSVADAKAQLSALIDRALSKGPQTITRYGKDAVVVVSAEEWARRSRRKGTLAEFFASSPLRDSGIDLERLRDPARDIEL